LQNTQLLGLSGIFNYNLLYFLKAALWITLGLMIWKFPTVLPSGLIRLRGTVILLALIFSLFHVLVFVIIGLITAFSKSSYNHSLWGIVSNLASLGAALAGEELCRSFLINGTAKKQPVYAIICFSIIFALFSIPLGGIGNLSGNLKILNFVTENVFPQLAQSIAASFLVYLAGPLPAIVYLGIIKSFELLSPYIPNPSEIPKLLFNLLFPLLSISIILKVYAGEASKYERYTYKKSETLSWTVVSVLSIAIVWFSVGVFPLFPSVILTGSMEPKIMPGDVMIVEKMNGSGANVGDIVMYYSEDKIYITHRVIEKTTAADSVQFVTKGDNNSSADPKLVSASQIKGRVIGKIPKVGTPVLYLKSIGNK